MFSVIKINRDQLAAFINDPRTIKGFELITKAVNDLQSTKYNSSDGSVGISTTVTTASLVGKTITIKDGLIVGFS